MYSALGTKATERLPFQRRMKGRKGLQVKTIGKNIALMNKSSRQDSTPLSSFCFFYSTEARARLVTNLCEWDCSPCQKHHHKTASWSYITLVGHSSIRNRRKIPINWLPSVMVISWASWSGLCAHIAFLLPRRLLVLTCAQNTRTHTYTHAYLHRTFLINTVCQESISFWASAMRSAENHLKSHSSPWS